jgi:hypothetical protein
MTGVVKQIVLASTLAVLAGIAASGPASAAGAPSTGLGGYCEGMSAPGNPRAGNQAPVLVADSAQAVAGTTVTIDVLANDSDPEGDQLFVTGTSTPGKGDVCVDSNGDLEYDAAGSSSGYTESFTYGVTDGDLYRTATVTVTVEGVSAVRAQLKHRLVIGKHSHKVTHRARVAFTNHNRRELIVVAFDPRTENPVMQRTLGAGRTTSFRTKLRHISYAVIVPSGEDDFGFVNFGELNTRNGRQTVSTYADQFFRSSGVRSLAQRLVRR